MANKSYFYINGKLVSEWADIPYAYLIAFISSDYRNGIFQTTVKNAKRNYLNLCITLEKIEELLAKDSGIHATVWKNCRKLNVFDESLWYETDENVKDEELDDLYLDLGASIHCMLEGLRNWEALDVYEILKKLENKQDTVVVKLDIGEIKNMFSKGEWYVDISKLFEDEKQKRDEDSKSVDIMESFKEKDVFICHDSDDKKDFVRPLAEKLQDEGIAVWYDEFSLEIGDSVFDKIEKGLQEYRFGIVVLSEHFLNNFNWPHHEYKSLKIKELSTGKKIIWRKNISKSDVAKYSLELSDKWAGKEKDGIVKLVEEIKKIVEKNKT